MRGSHIGRGLEREASASSFLGRRAMPHMRDIHPCAQGKKAEAAAREHLASSSGRVSVMAGESKRQDTRIVSWLFELHQSQKDEDKKEGQSSQWDFKYSHYPCASPVGPSDIRMLQIEAIFQNVLGYPRLPPRIHSFLCQGGRGEGVTVESSLETVEGLSERYGKELVLYLLKRCPLILLERFEDLSERADITRSMLDLKPHDMYMILRKNPLLLVMEPTEARARFNRLHRITPLSHESVTTMVRKFPLALNFTSESIEAKVERLRNLAYTRTTWQQHFDNIPPSLLAFYLRDSKDLLDRVSQLVIASSIASS